MHVAIVHDWLTGMRGGEHCLEVFCELFPNATLYTLIHVPGTVSPTIERMTIRTSRLSRVPGIARSYRRFLPRFPRAVERFDLGEADLVLSSSHCVAKGARKPAGACHICYCYTPMRYVWDLYESYFGRGQAGWLTRQAMRRLRPRLQRWDVATAANVDHFVAISRHVADRIRRHYRRDAEVIHPPVDARFFVPESRREDYYLVVSALAPYKRIDVAVEAFNRLGKPLLIVGTGPRERRLRALAGPSVRFAGWLPREALRSTYARCRALVFPGEEDFGIVPLEAQACGRPVIALGRGGTLETVVGLDAAGGDQPTGLFFESQSADALAEAVLEFERRTDVFDPEAIRRHALAFDRPIFTQRIRDALARVTAGHGDARC